MIFAHLIQTASSLPADASALESAISALESAITARESSSEFWEMLAWVFTGAVVIGVVIEVCVIFREHRDEMKEWRRGIVRPPDKPSHSLFVLGLVGSVLVALGVAGEFGAGIEVASINGDLRTLSGRLRNKTGQLIALLDKETADAQQRTGELEKDTAGLRTDEEKSRASIAAAQATAATANAKAETEKLTRIRMQEAMTPRSAGTNGKQDEQLQLFSRTKVFVTFASDTDSQDLAGNMIGLLQRANWDVIGWQQQQFSPSLQIPRMAGGANLTLISQESWPDGVWIMAKPKGLGLPDRKIPLYEQTGYAATLLCTTLKDPNNHIACETFARDPNWPMGLPDDAIWIVIGRKPMAYFRWASTPETQQMFIEMEKKNQTNSESDEKTRAYILAARRDFLNRRPK